MGWVRREGGVVVVVVGWEWEWGSDTKMHQSKFTKGG